MYIRRLRYKQLGLFFDYGVLKMMRTLYRILPSLLLTLAVFLCVPWEVWAQDAIDVRNQAKNIATQSSSMPKLMAIFGYVAGATLTVKGLLTLRKWMADPDNNPLTKAIAQLVVASLLVVLPYTIKIFTGTIGVTDTTVPSAVSSFQEKGMQAPGAGEDKGLRNTQYKVQQGVRNVPQMAAVLAYVAGAFFAATGLVRLKDWINDADRNPLMPAMFRLLTAALLIAFPHILLVVTSTFFAYNGDSVMVNVTTKMGKLDSFKKVH